VESPCGRVRWEGIRKTQLERLRNSFGGAAWREDSYPRGRWDLGVHTDWAESTRVENEKLRERMKASTTYIRKELPGGIDLPSLEKEEGRERPA